jgi:hypothetical protein
MKNASVVAETMWKCSGMALQLNLNCLIRAKNEELKIYAM